jgi:hypothetical protein
MHRRQWLAVGLALTGELALSGCRGSQFAKILHPGDKEMVGSHQAGQETFKPLVEEATGALLARHSTPPPHVQQVSMTGQEQLPPPPMRICFVAVENKSMEEIGDFKDQIYQIIDTHIVESHVFQPVNKRFVDAGLEQTRLRPDQIYVPQNMRAFTMAMEQAGQPFDFLLYATLTSGTTRENQNYQRDYLLTMEMVNVRTGEYDKQSATLTKGYYQTRLGRLFK